MHLAFIGYGNIAQTAARWLARRPVDALSVLVRSDAIARTLQDKALAQAATSVQVTDDIGTLITAGCDLVVECAGQAAVASYGATVLSSGGDLVIASVGALADAALAEDLQSAAQAGRGRMILPAGAIGGVDLLSALALAGPVTVRYRGTKPPQAWRGTPAEAACDLLRLTRPTTFFAGTAREAARHYPKNANVAATLALAGPGFDATEVALIADPAAQSNSHAYDVESETGSFAMQIDNAPSSGNAKTSVTTVYSLLREINRKRDALVL